jgi:hypothetical protein
VSHKRRNPVKRFVRWLFGAPFEELPPEFGDPVPSDLRVFEAKTEKTQLRAQGKVSPKEPSGHKQTKPVRGDDSLERE